MFSMTLVLALASTCLFIPANTPVDNGGEPGPQTIALSDDTPQDAPVAGRGRRQGRPPVVAAQGRRGRGSQEAERLTVYPLKHADCKEFAEIAGTMYPGMPIQADWRTNAVIVNASSEQLMELDKLIESLDKPAAVEAKRPDPTMIVPIQHRETNEMARHLSRLLGPTGLRVGADEGRSAVLLTGPAALIAQAEDILDDLDTPATVARLEFAFFKATMNGTDAEVDAEIPEDLREVVKELRRFGRIELLGRLHAVATQNEEFKISGLVSSGVHPRIRGRVVAAASKDSVKLSIDAEMSMIRPLAKQDGDEAKALRRGPSPEFSVETVVTTKRGHYVVLGSAPSGWSTGESAILVLQVLP